MYPGVAEKALLLGENLLAYGTIEALVSGVDVTVDSQGASQPERLTAVLAGKALRGVRVQALVGFQRALMTEGLFADGAFIGFSIGVNQLVFCEGMLGCEGLPTSWAGVGGTLSQVNRVQMDLEHLFGSKGLGALGAGVHWLDVAVLVSLHMPLQHILLLVLLATYVTRIPHVPALVLLHMPTQITLHCEFLTTSLTL